jgi:secreted trypsin-like serine protease
MKTINLISTFSSQKLVISAAHCLTELTISQTLLYIGSHDITSVTDTDFQQRGAQQLIVHPDYFRPNKTYSDADIGLIILNLPVIYTEYIKPICLWPTDQNSQTIVAKRGVVAGWGRDESGKSAGTPSVIEMPVVSSLECLTEDPLTFLKLTSNRTLCVGEKDGKGPCHGDSGSGFVIKTNGRWVLRGIVSAGLLDPVKQTCDLTNYVVLADAVKFMDWILSYLSY